MAHVVGCGFCGAIFNSIGNLNRHMLIHEHGYQCICDYCSFSTNRKDSLKRHCEKFHKHIEDISASPQPLQSLVAEIPSVTATRTDYITEKFDKRLQLPHNFIYAGASQSGKTTLLLKSLQNANKIYNPVPTRIFFFYSCYQNGYTKLKEQLQLEGIKCEFIRGEVVTEADLDAMADPEGGQTLIIVDDNSISAASSKEMAHLFTVARHKNCSIVLLLHFIFGPWPSSRIISANTAYFFLLKSPRMAKQIATLGSQVGKQRSLVSAYEREARKPYGYVLVDLCTKTPEHLRIRTNVFKEIIEPLMEQSKFTIKAVPEPALETTKTKTTDLLKKTVEPPKETILPKEKTTTKLKQTVAKIRKRAKVAPQRTKKRPNKKIVTKESSKLRNNDSDSEDERSSTDSSDTESSEASSDESPMKIRKRRLR